jgi:hypothetical protein
VRACARAYKVPQHDALQPVDVYAASRDVGGDEYLELARVEALERPSAVVRAELRGEGLCLDAMAREERGDEGDGLDLVGEDEYALVATAAAAAAATTAAATGTAAAVRAAVRVGVGGAGLDLFEQPEQPARLLVLGADAHLLSDRERYRQRDTASRRLSTAARRLTAAHTRDAARCAARAVL